MLLCRGESGCKQNFERGTRCLYKESIKKILRLNTWFFPRSGLIITNIPDRKTEKWMVAKLGKVNLMERRFSLQNISNLEDYSGGLYLRLSKEDDKKGGMNIADNSASIENQKALLEKYANEHHINIYDIYIDDGYSGTSFVEVR